MKISSKLYKLRTECDLTQEEFAKIAGVSAKSVSAWELGTRDPKIQPIRNICTHFGIDMNVFIDENIDYHKPDLPSNVRHITQMKKIPLVGTIACGTPILAEENITDYIDMPGHIRADYALTCKGDSMINAGIRDGDIVYIRKQSQVENGQIAAVLIGGEEATLKRFYNVDGNVTLNAENPAYLPITFIEGDAVNVRVIGLAVAYTHVLK